jgi:hypothetical protein
MGLFSYSPRVHIYLYNSRQKILFGGASHTHLPCSGKFFVLLSYSSDDMHACRNLPPHDDMIALIAKSKYLK